MAPPRPNGWKWCLRSQNRLDYIFYEILNLAGHQNCITGSRVTATLLKREFFPLDKVAKLVGGGSVINMVYPVQFPDIHTDMNKADLSDKTAPHNRRKFENWVITSCPLFIYTVCLCIYLCIMPKYRSP